ncbi:hypothetical protein PG993_012792 [Apiospora rasikravindrae]|uniref:Apple domain-containing protein n=1 Tax=Apiospora rasikravindrae TaxID=990691 RepID=A0ABR1RX19_9PEZI
MEIDDCPDGQRITLRPGYTVEYRRGRYREGDVHNGVNSREECIQLCQVDPTRPVCSFHEPTKKCIVGNRCGRDIVREGVCYMIRVDEIHGEEDPFYVPPPTGSGGKPDDPIKEEEMHACQTEKAACTEREGALQAEHAACQAQKGTLQAESSGCLARETVLQGSNAACEAQKATLQAKSTTCKAQRATAQNANAACQTSLQQCNDRAGASATSMHASRTPPAHCGRKGWAKGWYNVVNGMKMGECRQRCQSEARCVAYSDDMFADWGNCYLYEKQLPTLEMGPYPYWGTYAKDCA